MFKLSFDLPPSSHKMDINDPFLLIGSCFSDDIGQKLIQSKFNALSNPFGTIYNPYSIFNILKDTMDDGDLVENQGIYYHWGAHGAVSDLSKEDLSNKIETLREETQSFLKITKWLIVTLGTSIVYEREGGKVVANCHKFPGTQFKKRFLNQSEIIRQYQLLHDHLAKVNPDIQIIFTVSPVRHIKDGLINNNRSKSILIDAVHSIEKSYSNVHYFPSYEILIDELRDYRFYEKDMIHPSDQAVDYIWESFISTYLNQSTLKTLNEWSNLRSALDHKAFHPTSEKHQLFLKSTLQKLETLNEKLDMNVEIKEVRSQIL